MKGARSREADAAGASTHPAGRALLPVLFFVSGASGLVYEVVWLRMFAAVFGVTLYATSVVVACFMGGLAIGSFVVGRQVDRRGRGLVVYGALELALGLFALVLPTAIDASRGIYASVYDQIAPHGALLTLVRTVTSAALLIVPAALMGGTLPALSQHLTSRVTSRVTSGGTDRGRGSGETAARLYAVNTFGAVAGIFGAVAVLVPQLGARGANMACAAVNIAVGCVALWLARSGVAAGVRAPVASGADPDASPEPRTRAALVVAALSGFAALGYQMIWARAIALNTAETIFSFGATLSAFLAGIALGSRVLARLAVHKVGWVYLGVCQVGIAAFAAVSPLVLRFAFASFGEHATGTLTQVIGKHWLLVLAALILPTFLMGATVAIAFRLYQHAGAAGAAGIGRVYAANTVGAIGGSLVTGMWLVPRFGMVRALAVLVAVNLLAAFAAGRRAEAGATGAAGTNRRLVGRLAIPAVGALAIWVLLVSPARFFERGPGHVVFSREDASGVVEVIEADGVRTLVANRVNTWGSNAPDNVDSSKRQGFLPLFIHPQPRRVIEVGLATGAASAPFLLDPRVEQLVVVEISPAIVAASQLFGDANGHIAAHPRARVVVDDGRSYLMLSRETFDVVILGLFTPYTPWASLLFSRELYAAARDRLAPGGVVVQWLPLQQLTPDALRSVLTTFQSVFPEAHVWEKSMYLALVGAREPLELRADTFERVGSDPALRAESGRLGFARPAGVLATYFMGPRKLAAFARGGLLNTEDEPRVEWSPAQSHGDRFELLVENLEQLLESRAPDEMPLSGFSEEQRQEIARAFDARGHSLRGAMHEITRQYDRAMQAYRRAVALYPDDEFAGPQLRKFEAAIEAVKRERGVR